MARRPMTVMLFLISIFLLLIIYLFFWVGGVYTKTTAYANKTGPESVECIGYVFSIRGVSYSPGQLRFEVLNEKYSDADITELIAESGNQTETIKMQLSPGMARKTSLNIEVEKEFIIYPPGCKTFKKTCNTEGTCI